MKPEQLDQFSEIQIYNFVLDGTLDQFPRNFWTGTDGQERAKIILIYFFEEIQQWDREKIKRELNCRILRQYKLGGLINVVFNNNLFDAVNCAYPGKYEPKDLYGIKSRKSTIHTEAKRLRKVLKGKNRHEILELYTHDFLREHKFNVVLKRDMISGAELLKLAFPSYNFHIWELKRFVSDFQDRSTRIMALDWLADKTGTYNFTKQDFLDHNMARLWDFYGSSVSAAILDYCNTDMETLYDKLDIIFKQSSLTDRQFAVKHGLPINFLNRWKNRLPYNSSAGILKIVEIVSQFN